MLPGAKSVRRLRLPFMAAMVARSGARGIREETGIYRPIRLKPAGPEPTAGNQSSADAPSAGSMPEGTLSPLGSSGGNPPAAIQWLSWKTQAITSATTV